MKKLIFFVLFFNGLLALGQDEFPSKWEYRFQENIYYRAFDFYLKETGQGWRSKLNVDFQKPVIGIYLISAQKDTLVNLEKLLIRFCIDDSWKEGQYDSFSFFGTTLLLINSGSGEYVPNERWEKLVQDRVYIRKPIEERLFPTFLEEPRTSIKLEKANYEGGSQFVHRPSLHIYRDAPYFYRKLVIDHSKGKFEFW